MAGAKKKIDLFVEIQTEKDFDNIIKNNTKQLICAEVYSAAFGSCNALDRLFTKIKCDWSDDQIILLKVPADEVESFKRFRHQSEPVYVFIVNMKVTKVFRGVDSIRFTEVVKKELYYFRQELQGFIYRASYDLDKATPDETDWLNSRDLEKKAESESLSACRAERQAARKRHRAVLMVPHLTELNFVFFWPHCFHAHPELYERWDANNIVMVGREEIELTEEMVKDIFYAGDAPLNEASLHKLLSGPALAICFRLLDDYKHFVSLVRKILYEEIPQYDETKSIEEQQSMKTAYDLYKTFSPTREQIWQQRFEERERRKEETKEKRARRLSEMQRLARTAIEEAIEAKRAAREQLKLDLLKAGNLKALDELKAAPDDEVNIVVPEELYDVEEEESTEEENDDEYFPPPGLLIPGFYAPPNDIAKANGLAILFPNLVLERVTPQPEFLPPHLMVMVEIAKRHRAIEIMAPYKSAIIHMGIFKVKTPYDGVHIAYTVKQYETLDNTSLNLDEIKLVFMLSVEVDVPLLHLMDLNPAHVSRDTSSGEEECAAMFPVDYGDEYDQFEDFL